MRSHAQPTGGEGIHRHVSDVLWLEGGRRRRRRSGFGLGRADGQGRGAEDILPRGRIQWLFPVRLQRGNQFRCRRPRAVDPPRRLSRTRPDRRRAGKPCREVGERGSRSGCGRHVLFLVGLRHLLVHRAHGHGGGELLRAQQRHRQRRVPGGAADGVGDGFRRFRALGLSHMHDELHGREGGRLNRRRGRGQGGVRGRVHPLCRGRGGRAVDRGRDECPCRGVHHLRAARPDGAEPVELGQACKTRLPRQARGVRQGRVGDRRRDHAGRGPVACVQRRESRGRRQQRGSVQRAVRHEPGGARREGGRRHREMGVSSLGHRVELPRREERRVRA